MASGIAKTIRKKWPEVYQRFMENPSGASMLGCAHVICVDHTNDLHIANMYTQIFYGYGGGKYADAEGIEMALRFVASTAHAYEIPVYMPRVGCGLGGLDWITDVQPRVLRVALEFPDIDIVVCDLPSQKEDNTNEFVTY